MSELQALDRDLAVTDGSVAPERGSWHRFEPVIFGTTSVVVLLVVWELLPRLITMSPGTKLFFTTPSQIAGTLWSMFATGMIWKPLGVSASGFAVGLALAIVIGLPLGVLIG